MDSKSERVQNLLNEARKGIAVNSRISSPFLLMNALATVVASYGLLLNSPAVVIGAMIIAMLMGPILGLALALVDGDNRLLWHSILAEALGVLMVVVIAALIGKIHSTSEITAEILARTKPNIFDLIVALAGGAAAAYATVSPRVSVGLVGVAISTALVPPLASCGICISRGMPAHAFGAFILFATNLVAIQSASSVVLYLSGFRGVLRWPKGDKVHLRKLAVDGVLLLILGVFLYLQLMSTIGRQQFEKSITEQLNSDLQKLPGAHLAEARFVETPEKSIVVAVVRAPYSITPDQTAELEKKLVRWERKPLELHVRSLITKETTRDGYLHEIAPEEPQVDSSNEGVMAPTPVLPRSDGPAFD